MSAPTAAPTRSTRSIGWVPFALLALVVGTGWAINLAIAEWILRRSRHVRSRRLVRTGSIDGA